MVQRVIAALAGLLMAGCLIDPDYSLLEDGGPVADRAALEAAPDRGVDLPDPGDGPADGPATDQATPDQATPDQGPAPDQAPDQGPPPPAQLLAVRSGGGTIADLASSATLSLSPAVADVGKTLLVFQATSSDANPTSANVRCRLSSASQIACDRVGTAGAVNVQWYVAEFKSGVTVQHLQPSCDVSGTTTVSIAAVDPKKTFLLYSGRRAGSIQGEDDMETVELVDATTVEIRKASAACDSDARSLQVVELDGASVTRGVTGAMSGTNLDVTGLAAADTTRTFLLYSYRGTLNGATMCDRMVRGTVLSSTSLSFNRGDGASGCAAAPVDAIAWERVELPAGMSVQQLKASVSAGSGAASLSITQVDTGRTLALAGGQWTAGQGIGEGSLSTDDILGAMVGRLELKSSTTLGVTRDHTGGKASWSAFVIEF